MTSTMPLSKVECTDFGQPETITGAGFPAPFSMMGEKQDGSQTRSSAAVAGVSSRM